MKSIILELYEGRLNPYECLAPNSDEYKSVNRLIAEGKERLKQVLGDNYKELNELEKLYTQSSDEVAAQAFQSGFCIAALFMIEVFTRERPVPTA